MNPNDSLLYTVDSVGRVRYLNTQTATAGCASPKWTLLPNPTRVDLKRISSRNGLLWGIGSDHQIYIYVHKQDIPIRVREETFENQRWNPLGGFCSQLLPTDRHQFSTEDGLTPHEKSTIKLSSVESWSWESDWQIENTFNNELIEGGWSYAVDFPATYHPQKSWNSCVRRRKWFRTRRFIGFNRWIRIDPIHQDYTQEPFTDVNVNVFGSNLELHCVWTVTILGQVYFRSGVTPTNPEGSYWEKAPIRKGLEACQITVTGKGIPFVVAWTGSCMYRTGISPQQLSGTDWVEVNGPPGGLSQLSAGDRSLWSVSREKKCWILKCDLTSVGDKRALEWNEIPGKLKLVSVSKNDMVVLGVSDDDKTIFVRLGITPDELSGQGWKEAFGRVSWDTVSTTSSAPSVTADRIMDQVDSGRDSLFSGGDSVSLDSVRPDFPETFKLEVEDSSSETELEAISFTWVDGGCLSCLKSGNDIDLEVGPRRDEILSGLQSLKVKQESFTYPNAVDEDASEWHGKSTAARMLHHGHESWVKGQLEVVNNHTLVFHQDLTRTWCCAMKDILSVLRTRELSFSFTLRVRNPIEQGVADFISFKFSNDKDLREWHSTVIELSDKNHDEFSLGNLWLTTTNGELVVGGMIKIADTAIGADMIVPSDSGYSNYHPLIKGFLPGSTLKVDIFVPAEAQWFILNLEGRNVIAFHFNPRFNDEDRQVVVRNTKRNGIWEEEERDGVFPFRPGNRYSVTFECLDTHVITTVGFERKKFSFKYKHRVLPRFVTNFSSGGNVSILGIRYDPKTGDKSATPEFVTATAPGHFWKVEATPNGFIWAIGFDSGVWMCGNSSVLRKKSEFDTIVTDDQTCYIYENQRWNPLSGFGAHGLPTDRSAWSDISGRIALDKDKVKVPTSDWTWVDEWTVDYNTPQGVDTAGWQYAIDYPASYHPSKRFNDFVRRRRWKRTCRYAVHGPWISVTGVKLVDLCIQMNEDCDWEVLGISVKGDAVVRCGITPENPVGTNWEFLPAQKPFISIGSAYGQHPWAIGKDGFAYIRYGHNWQLLDRPKETPLKSVRLGSSGVWAVGTNNVLYKRTAVLPILPEGQDWAKVGEGVTQVSLGLGDEVWALLKSGDVFQTTLVKRKGIAPDHPYGIGWETVAEGPWSHFSLPGAFRRIR